MLMLYFSASIPPGNRSGANFYRMFPHNETGKLHPIGHPVTAFRILFTFLISLTKPQPTQPSYNNAFAGNALFEKAVKQQQTGRTSSAQFFCNAPT